MEEIITDESDHGNESPKGYFTRAKRRKLSENYQEDGDEEFNGIPEVGKRKNPIMFVPTEVIQCIFKYISYHEMCTKVRLVNRRFKIIAENLLNINFKNIEKKLDNLIKIVDLSLGYTQDEMEIKCIVKLLWMLEILKQQHMVIFATIWRYVYNDYYKTQRACMYGGLILDIHNVFFRKFIQCPNQLYAQSVIKDYALPQEVTKIIKLTKSFCIHFDKTNEETLSDACVLSGCKILDLLNCSKFSQINCMHFERCSNMIYARYTYFFKNSWFCAIDIPLTKEMDWAQKQRLMHMRLRRIVLAHNDMFLQHEQYERELMLRPTSTIKRPGNNVYTGYGDVENKFFYYGVMNEAAYIAKFHSEEDADEQDNEDEIMDQQPPFQEPAFNDLIVVNSEEDVLYRLPYLGFKIDVSVACPLKFAPLNYLNSLNDDERAKLKKKRRFTGETEILMNFECMGAHYARLPSKCHFKLLGRKELKNPSNNDNNI